MKRILFLLLSVSLLLMIGCGTTAPSTDGAEDTSVAVTRKIVPPFMAAEGMATLDGVIDDAEWASAVKYSLVYNQLNEMDTRPPKDQGDISGDWAIMFSGNMLYGYVTRMDDTTYTGEANVWENDCVEVMLDYDGKFAQLRTLIGEDFAGGDYPATAVWNADGSVLEYSVELTSDAAGKLMGWSLALADNDGSGREYQLYPINGQNDNYTGANLGTVTFGKKAVNEGNVLLPFKAMASSGITVDGVATDEEWADAVKYQFAYNQLDAADQTMNRDYSDSYGDWCLVYEGNMLYGMVNRVDDIDVNNAPNTWENDTFEIELEINGKFSQLSSILGGGFASGTFAGDAVWSEDGTVFEFSCDLGTAAADLGIIGFNLALADNDDGNVREAQYYPVYGFNDCYTGANLAELEFIK